MSRIQKTFERLAAAGRKGLVPYVTAGYPSRAATPAVLDALVAAGADLAEALDDAALAFELLAELRDRALDDHDDPDPGRLGPQLTEAGAHSGRPSRMSKRAPCSRHSMLPAAGS